MQVFTSNQLKKKIVNVQNKKKKFDINLKS